MSELIPVVNEQDEIIDHKERLDITKDDIYRVAGAILYNQKGEILLAQRGLHKQNNPGQWSVSTAGTVEKGETYEENIAKEIPEEIGVKGIKLELLGKLRVQGQHSFFTQVYLGFCNLEKHEFILEYPQVNDIMWVSQEELEKFKTESNFSISKTLFTIVDKYQIFDKIKEQLSS